MDSGVILVQVRLNYYCYAKIQLESSSASTLRFDFKNFRSEERIMAYNKAREERKWKQWKKKEKKILRTLGMDEKSIQKLREFDWKDFKAERCYQDHWASFPENQDWESQVLDEQEINNIPLLLDSIDDEHLLHILRDTDRSTLQILLMRIMGFSVTETAEELGITEHAIHCRINKLKIKIIKFS